MRRSLALALVSGQITHLVAGGTGLSDCFARVLVAEDGPTNLQNLVKAEPVRQSLVGPQWRGAGRLQRQRGALRPAQPGAPAAGVTGAAASLGPDIWFGPVSLVNGQVFFSDRFMLNYSATLTELTGGLSALSSHAAVQGDPPAQADLALRGRAGGPAALEIKGKLNPLAQGIQGEGHDLALPPLPPCAVKYAGGGIERGKLRVDGPTVWRPTASSAPATRCF